MTTVWGQCWPLTWLPMSSLSLILNCAANAKQNVRLKCWYIVWNLVNTTGIIKKNEKKILRKIHFHFQLFVSLWMNFLTFYQFVPGVKNELFQCDQNNYFLKGVVLLLEWYWSDKSPKMNFQESMNQTLQTNAIDFNSQEYIRAKAQTYMMYKIGKFKFKCWISFCSI